MFRYIYHNSKVLCHATLCRGTERGTARPEVLEALLGTTDRVVQEIDSVEYGLTDIQEYYANTGRLCCEHGVLLRSLQPYLHLSAAAVFSIEAAVKN